jgi:type I restriction enzyme, R subunit
VHLLSFPAAVLEAKAEDKSPLDGKEQSRRYAQSQNARFIIPTTLTLDTFSTKIESVIFASV